MMPFSSDYYLRKNYETVIRELKALGFSNVTSKQTTDHFWSPSSIDSTVKILVGNETKFEHGKVFSKSSSITVFYHVSDFAFDQQTVSITEKDTFEIPYSVTSGDNTDLLQFSIDNPNVLRRNTDGSYTALIPGTAKVTVSCGGNQSSTCTVEVAEIIIPIDGLLFANDEIDVVVGSYFTLDYTTYPQDANYTEVTAEVSSKIIEISENNRYYANEAGDTEITLYQDDRMLGTCIVHASVVQIEELAIHESPHEIYIGDTFPITFDLMPENANCKGIVVKSSDPQMVGIEFDERGDSLIQVTGLSAGKTNIFITIPNGTQYTIPVTVNEIIPSEIRITSNDPTARIEVGTPVSLNVNWEPDNTSVKELTWSSSNNKVIKVSAEGNLETVGIGTAEITAAHHSGVSGMISLTVEPTLVTQIEISSNLDPEKAFNKGNKCKVKVSLFPENATDKSVTYTSSDTSILKVSEKGEVTATGVGTATITATSKDGPSASIAITVSPLPQKFKITWSAKMVSNDHVGNGWSKSFSVNDKSFASGSTITLKPDDYFTVCLEIQQNDDNPDYGYFEEDIEYSEELCKSGYKINSYIIVEENGGRYRGHYAEWEFTINITPVK